MQRTEALEGDEFVVARVQIQLADGASETWMVPLRLSDDALSYRAFVHLPEGAMMASVEPMTRRGGTREELVFARATIEE
jgi:hypothetical protein